MNRRTSIFLLASSLAATSNKAFGQDVIKSFSGDFVGFADLESFAVKLEGVKDFPGFVERSFFYRRQVVADANRSGLFDNKDIAIAALRKTIGSEASGIPSDFFSKEAIEFQIDAISFVSSQGLPLVPDERDILPIGIPNAGPSQSVKKDSNLKIILEIAGQTLGIYEGKKLADEALDDNDIKKILNEINSDLDKKDWEAVIGSCQYLFKVLVASKIVQKILGEQFLKTFAFRLALRCAPIIGWAYVIAAFIVALKANYHRFSFA